ncbi:MAG: hypothetical protein HYZ13_10535 [Acidobacteria bacterium]|nr:hypothetical protein [Acidobacteriota bacterium]
MPFHPPVLGFPGPEPRRLGARKVYSFPPTGQALQRRIEQRNNDTLLNRERDLARHPALEVVGKAADPMEAGAARGWLALRESGAAERQVPLNAVARETIRWAPTKGKNRAKEGIGRQ